MVLLGMKLPLHLIYCLSNICWLDQKLLLCEFIDVIDYVDIPFDRHILLLDTLILLAKIILRFLLLLFSFDLFEGYTQLS